MEVNNEWVSAIVKDKFSDRNFLDASGALEPRSRGGGDSATRKNVGCRAYRAFPLRKTSISDVTKKHMA